MKTSQILTCISRVLFPFIILFGLYVIINGHLSPGGGFQGGAILATGILITYFTDPLMKMDLNSLVKVEKYAFLIILIIATLSLVTRGELFTNFLPLDSNLNLKPIFLVILNFFIGTKVAIGLVTIFSTFLEEGR